MQQYDVAVIGLGAVGSAALYQLSKTGQRVIGIDRYTPPHAHGSSFGESRVTRQALAEGSAYAPLLKRANEIWQELEQLSEQELYNRSGMLIAGYEEQIFFKDTVEQAKTSGIEHRLMDGKEAEGMFPVLNTAGSDQVFYYEPSSGFLRPEKCVEVQLQAARDNQAQISLNSSVTAIRETKDGVDITLENGEVITTAKVIVATGPWIKELLPEAFASVLKSYLYTQYWFELDEAHASDFAPHTLPVMLMGVDKAPRTRAFTGFPLVGKPEDGLKFVLDDSELEIGVEQKDDPGFVQPGLEELKEYIQRYYQHVKPEVVRSSNCVYTSTPDNDFIIDFAPNSQRIVIGSACSGHGFKYSSATGEALAQLASTGSSAINLAPFSLSRF